MINKKRIVTVFVILFVFSGYWHSNTADYYFRRYISLIRPDSVKNLEWEGYAGNYQSDWDLAFDVSEDYFQKIAKIISCEIANSK